VGLLVFALVFSLIRVFPPTLCLHMLFQMDGWGEGGKWLLYPSLINFLSFHFSLLLLELPVPSLPFVTTYISLSWTKIYISLSHLPLSTTGDATMIYSYPSFLAPINHMLLSWSLVSALYFSPVLFV
jgi:hypothetical protein